MKNILIITPKDPSAVHILGNIVKKYNPHFNIKLQPLHPKRPSVDQMHTVSELIKWVDLIDVEYWRSGKVLKKQFPKIFFKKKKILTHHNPYDVNKEKWGEYEKVIVKNQTQKVSLPRARVIPHCIDINYFKFNRDYTNKKTVNMVAARIEGKKGIRETAWACNQLGYKFILVGRVSSPDYMGQVEQVGGDALEFHEDVPKEELRDCYYKSAIHVCNSVDNFESGPMPLLEAMSCGVPIVTRRVGLVPDIENGKNMIVREGEQGDKEELKNILKELMENPERREKLRQAGWKTVKNRQPEKMARMYSELYYEVLGGDNPLVSIVIPTYNRYDALVDVLAAALKQDYEHYEVVVADSSDKAVLAVIEKIREKTEVPIKYVRIDRREGEYTLAKARNEAVIEAEGEILVFNDDRIAMEKDAVSKFVERIEDNFWLWGTKDGVPKGFVENFSCVKRNSFIKGGMFNERIDEYGGMSQEIRERYKNRLGFHFEHIKADAHQVASSSAKYTEKESIAKMKLKLWKMYK